MPTPPVKKIIVWLLTIFLLYAILTSPEEAAGIFDSTFDIIGTGIENIGSFFDQLITS